MVVVLRRRREGESELRFVWRVFGGGGWVGGMEVIWGRELGRWRGVVVRVKLGR